MSSNISLGVLDLCPILSGETSSESLTHVKKLAQFTESVGYDRYWVAEHHNMLGIGSSSPEVLIAHIAENTKTIKVGSGGIMLPNHSTFHIAEVFRTLHALYPERIELGLGRAPGSGSKATKALRSGHMDNALNFPNELEDLIRYFNDDLDLKAVPVDIPAPHLWILGSSDFGARLAAERGLSYSFAQHFSGLNAIGIIEMYKDYFKPSEFLSKPDPMLGCHIICADTEEEAQRLALSSDLSFALVIQTGTSGKLMSVGEAEKYKLSDMDRGQVRASFPKFVGTKESVRKQLKPYLEAGIEKFMITSMIHDQEARKYSYQLIREML